MPQPLRLLLVAHNCSPSGGSEARVSFEVAEHLANQGVEVTVLRNGLDPTSPINPEDVPTHKLTKYISVDVDLEAGRFPVKPFVSVRYQQWLRRSLKLARQLHEKRPFDVVHHLSWSSLLQGSPFHRLGLPFVMGPVGGGVKTPPDYSSEFVNWRSEAIRSRLVDLIRFNPFSQAIVRNASFIVASNPETAQVLTKMGVKEVQAHFDDAIGDDELRESPIVQSTSGPLRVLWLSRMFEIKALRMALAAIAQANEETPIVLTLIGDGPDRARNAETIDRLAKAGTLIDMGWCDQAQIEVAYQSNDVLLYNSLRDNGSAPLHAATRFGMPAVVLDHQGPGFIADPTWAVKVPLSNPEQSVDDLAAALILLARDPAKRVEMGNASLAASHRNRWSDWARYLADVYRDLAADAGSEGRIRRPG